MAKVLIVDDTQAVLTDLNRCLTGAGHSTIMANDGVEGLERILTDNQIQIVITDVHMPGKNGIEMLKAARAELGEWSFKAFVMTTDTSEELKQQGKKLGVTAWIIKPVNHERLLAAIAQTLAT